LFKLLPNKILQKVNTTILRNYKFSNVWHSVIESFLVSVTLKYPGFLKLFALYPLFKYNCYTIGLDKAKMPNIKDRILCLMYKCIRKSCWFHFFLYIVYLFYFLLFYTNINVYEYVWLWMWATQCQQQSPK
jgi:hypothetical protein